LPENISGLKLVEVITLKQWAYASLPTSSSLREVLLQENDNLTIEEFFAKMDIWLKLCRFEDASTALRAGSCAIAAY